jgi:hypothetical protein
MATLARPLPHEEVVVPLRAASTAAVPPVTHVRSTLLAASILSVRSRGHLDAYLTHLPPALHETVLQSVAGSWIPLDVAVAHYRAADRLGLRSDEQYELGRGVAERVQNSVLGTLGRVAKGAGVTPWIGLEYFQRLWDRVLLGGSVAVYRLGPKEARAEGYGIPTLAEIPYFRNSFRGMFAGSGLLFCNKMYIADLAPFVARRVIGFRVAWA